MTHTDCLRADHPVDDEIVDATPTPVGATPARWDAKDGWNLLGTMGAVKRFLRKTGIHFADGKGGWDELEMLADICRQANAILDAAIRAELENGSSFAEIAEHTGRHQQSIARTYKGVSVRKSGGQPAGTR